MARTRRWIDVHTFVVEDPEAEQAYVSVGCLGLGVPRRPLPRVGAGWSPDAPDGGPVPRRPLRQPTSISTMPLAGLLSLGVAPRPLEPLGLGELHSPNLFTFR